MTVHLKELVTDTGTGTLSHTKVLSLVAHLAVLVLYIKNSWEGPMSSELTLIILGVVAGNATASKIISLKYPTPKEETNV